MKYAILILCASLFTTFGMNTQSQDSLISPKEVTTEQSSNEDFTNPFSDNEEIVVEKLKTGSTQNSGIKPDDRIMKKPPFWYKYNFGKRYVTDLQKKLNILVSDLVSDYKSDMTIFKAFLVFFVSFIYSILHSAGPGHGKLILGTYFLTSDQKRKKMDAAIAGIIVSVTHNGMAVLLSGVLYLFIRSFGDQRHMQEVAKQIGGFFVILTGIAIMATTIFKNKIHLFGDDKNAEKLKNYPLYFIAMLSGIVPCPLAWTVLVMCITLGLYGLGLISVLGMALGAGLTVGTTGLIIITGKDKLFSFVNRGKAEKVAYIVRFFGGVFLVLFGYLMTKVI